MKAIINLNKEASKDVFSTLNALSSSINIFQQVMLQEKIDKYVDDIDKEVSEDKRNRFGLFEPTKRENKFFFMRKFNFSYGSSHEILGGNCFDNKVLTSFFYNDIDVRISTVFNLDLFSDLKDLSFLSRKNNSVLISISSDNMPDNDKMHLLSSIVKSLSRESGFYKLKDKLDNLSGDKQWEFFSIKSSTNNNYGL